MSIHWTPDYWVVFALLLSVSAMQKAKIMAQAI